MSNDQKKGLSRSGPSSQSVNRGLEGSILDQAGATGAGSEAARGLHAKSDSSANETSNRAGEAQSDEGRAGESPRGAEADVETSGSEPLSDSARQHESGYGGRGGEPRTSSDQREH